jgi:DNA polymerase II large subunit
VEDYFSLLDRQVSEAYAVAERARARGIDPEPRVEIPRAEDMASRVEKLLARWQVEGIARRIRELSSHHPREEVALLLARELAADVSRGSVERRVETALRVGLAILTEGILVAPLEGLADVRLHPDPAGDYLELFYAGPIRAAGGTAQALSVLLADVVRQQLGIAPYRPTEEEVGRYKEELPVYKHCQHLQYVPTSEEIEQVVRGVAVCINGEATEAREEVSAFRDLPRVGTNGIRGGACLVIAEGLCQKASKLRKVVERLGLPGWDFLERLGHGPAAEEEGSAGTPKYLAEAVGGRPILAHPHRPGGFRLAYGRCRTSGLASCAINPATMVLLRNFVAVGTQLKLEFPGKASAMSLCDTIEGPIVLLDDASLVQISDVEEARRLVSRVRRIVDLGEMLVSYGEFLENNRPLVPGAYTLAWHLALLRRHGVPLDRRACEPTWEEALEDSQRHGVPLHPSYNLFWHDLSREDLRTLSIHVEERGRWRGSELALPRGPEIKEMLITLGVLHREEAGEIVIPSRWALPLGLGLGLVRDGEGWRRRAEVSDSSGPTLEEVQRLSGIEIRPRGPTRIGARVGRPEKAHERTMKPNVHVLFPLGEAGGAQRSFVRAITEDPDVTVPVTLGVRRCPACQTQTIWARCPCGAHTEPTGRTQTQAIPVGTLFRASLERLGLPRVPGVKGVKGLVSESKTPEPLEKGILRATHGIGVYQDGTARFDLSDLPLTHFRPREVGLSVARARDLGYTQDWLGESLTSEEQLLELRPHDIIVAESCGDYLVELSRFLDEELRRLYGEPPFYRARRREDLLGTLVIALAPHTSGGVLGRLIGYTPAEACFAHPVFHAAKRRNCDGDEDSITLLLDGLLNFSYAYLPESRGGLMDKPLVLTTRLDVREVDKEAHNVDIDLEYRPEFYEAAARGAHPRELEPLFETLGRRAAAGASPFQGLGFTHDTTDIAGGPVRSAYRESQGMATMVEQELELMASLRAVDLSDAVARTLSHHFLPDLMGNLKRYATQSFRCRVCNTSYRRPPLGGRCGQTVDGHPCGGSLLPTVYEAAVDKYLGLSRHLAERYGVSPYLRQRLELLESSLETMFPAEGRRGRTLDGFLLGKEPPPAMGDPSSPAKASGE